MSLLSDKINSKDASAFTHSGKFHADDVFSAALLLYLNPEIHITRGNRVPEEFEGIVFDIGRGAYDHHQQDSRVRENGIAYAAFGLLWEKLGSGILGEELALRFDNDFVQPLDNNDNTGERNELASLIGDFNPTWDAEGGNDAAFFEAVNLAGTILENKFAKYLGNERADQQVEVFLNNAKDKILVMPQFVPCQKKLSETEIEFIVFPSNRGGYCVQPLKKAGSMNFKCSFPKTWLGLEEEELRIETGLASANFCHKGGFLLTLGELEDAVEACHISQKIYIDAPIVVYYHEKGDAEAENNILKALERKVKHAEGMEHAVIKEVIMPELPAMVEESYYQILEMEKQEWKEFQKKYLKKILKYKPEAVVVDGTAGMAYPMMRLLRKKRIPVLTILEKTKEIQLLRSV